MSELLFIACEWSVWCFVGDTVQVIYTLGTDSTPLYQTSSVYHFHGLTGFRIWTLFLTMELTCFIGNIWMNLPNLSIYVLPVYIGKIKF